MAQVEFDRVMLTVALSSMTSWVLWAATPGGNRMQCDKPQTYGRFRNFVMFGEVAGWKMGELF